MAILQATLATSIRVFGVSPDLALLVTVSWTLLRGQREGVLVALLSGAVLDAISAGPFGTSIASLLVVSFLAGLGEINVFRTTWLLPYATIAAATVISYLIALFVLQTARQWPGSWGVALWRIVAPAVLVNTLFMIPLYHLSAWLRQQLMPRTVEWQ